MIMPMFFIDNVIWSDKDSSYVGFVSEDGEGLYTENVCLDILYHTFLSIYFDIPQSVFVV